MISVASESNGSSSTAAGSTTSTNAANHPQNRLSVYNANNNSCTTAPATTGAGGSSNGRTLNSSGQKRRIPPSHANANSYVNNLSMSKLHNTVLNGDARPIRNDPHPCRNTSRILDGLDKSQHHHHHHHHHHGAPTHYSGFYPEMGVQPAVEPVDLAAAAEFDKERQMIGKSLSKLSLPVVSDVYLLCKKDLYPCPSMSSRYKISRVAVP